MPQRRNDFPKKDDSSLGAIAVKFFKIIETKGKEEIDLNDAAISIGVKKRRMYDVINVMQGCEMIYKKDRNKYVNHCKEDRSKATQKRNLQNKIQKLKEEEQSLNFYIDSFHTDTKLKQYMSSHELNTCESNLFLTKRDIASAVSLKCSNNKNAVLAICLPPMTTVHVPHSTTGVETYKIQMNCPENRKITVHEVKYECKISWDGNGSKVCSAVD